MGNVYWDCRCQMCKAKAVTAESRENEEIIIFKRPADFPYAHPPNLEECDAMEVLTQQMKRKTMDHPEQPSTQL